MSSPVPPRGDPDCPRCGGEGYVLEPRVELTTAAVCPCVGPCHRCGSTGWRRVGQPPQVRVGRCRCQMLPDRVKLLSRAGIPARHAHSSLASYDRSVAGAEANYQTVRAWLDGFRPGEENPGLVLFGSWGRGKTHLMVALVRELVIRHGIETRFVEFSHLIAQLKAGFDEGVGEATTLRPLVRVPVLVVDELGKGRATEWELTIIDALVSHRYNALATILATTNYRPGASTGRTDLNLSSFMDKAPPGAGRRDRGRASPTLGDRIGDRVMSRLKEMCTFAPVYGEDYRSGRT